MTVEEIRVALHKHPFEPFFILLTDGTEQHVPHRDFVSLGKRRVTVIDAVTDALSIIDPLHIISVEYREDGLPPKRQSNEGGNP